jgi:hypothetical protein
MRNGMRGVEVYPNIGDTYFIDFVLLSYYYELIPQNENLIRMD